MYRDLKSMYFLAMKWDRNTIYVVFYSLNFLKPIHDQNVHLLPQYTPYNDIWIVANEISLMACSIWSQYSMNTGFLDTNLTRTLPQWLLWGSFKNLHDCISTLVISGTSISSAPINFKLVSECCYCYPYWWWCIKCNPPTSLNFNILHFPVTTLVHLMIISPLHDERVAMLFQCLLDHTQQKLYFCLISVLRNNVSKSVDLYINLRLCMFNIEKLWLQ